MAYTEWVEVERPTTSGGYEKWRERYLLGGGPDLGPVGSGVLFWVDKDEWQLLDDGVWGRTVLAWRIADDWDDAKYQEAIARARSK